MKHALTATLASLLAAACLAPAAPIKTAQVPANARWIAHLDMTRLLQGQMGQFLLSEMDNQGANDKFAAFQTIFNFDPRRDIDGITLFGATDNPDEGVVLVHGRFDAQRLITLIRANDDYGTTSHDNQVIHQWVDDKNKATGELSYGTIFTDGTVLLSSQQSGIAQALDVLTGKAANLSQGGSLSLAAKADSAFLVAVADYAAISQIDPQAAMFKQAKSGSLRLGEVGGKMEASVTLDAQDTETAGLLHKIAQGLVAIGLLGAQDNPDMARLAQATQISLEGSRVTMEMAFPVQDMIRLIKEDQAKKAAANPAP